MKTNLRTEDLTCPSCIKKIESGIGKKEGVSKVDVKFNLNKVTVEHDESVTGDELKNVIEKLGYPVKSVKSSA
ncbi:MULTISPECIES: heavy-metal-associated domain-containing protein [Salinicoccus]|uniref:Heavy-metal-associated domain-containing protein n=2 Tax=Salinicoccus TaxID=45669 RepID=A0A285UJE4_9STAP|nr:MULTISPECIES: heavy metal-associated domain-containing protein [Salinicoccus]MCD2138529.1 heavy-metal-associated domain-containing protein [Salinicoccus halitifaciens]SOC42034.1 heavy-metal-associated domain-containing protein [Salinicoccus kekensis]